MGGSRTSQLWKYALSSPARMPFIRDRLPVWHNKMMHNRRLFDDVEVNWKKAPQCSRNWPLQFLGRASAFTSFCNIPRILEDGEIARWGILLTLVRQL